MKIKIILLMILLNCYAVMATPGKDNQRIGDNGPIKFDATKSIFDLTVKKAPTNSSESPTGNQLTCGDDKEGLLFDKGLRNVKDMGKAMILYLDPCNETREFGAEHFCACVNKKSAQKIYPYGNELSPGELEVMKNEIINKDKISRLNNTIDDLGIIINKEMLGKNKIEGCSIQELRELPIAEKCSDEGTKLILAQFPTESNIGSNVKTLRDLLDKKIYENVRNLTSAYEQSHNNQPLLSEEDFKKKIVNEGEITNFLVPFEIETPKLLKQAFKTGDQALLRKLKSTLNIEENSWRDFFSVDEIDGVLSITIKSEEIIKKTQEGDPSKKLFLQLNVDGQKQGGSSEGELEGFLEQKDGAEKLVDQIMSGRGYEDSNLKCKKIKEFLTKVCEEGHKLNAADIIEQCFETTNGLKNFVPANQRKELALCQTFSGMMSSDFFRFNGDLFGSSGAGYNSMERCPQVKSPQTQVAHFFKIPIVPEPSIFGAVGSGERAKVSEAAAKPKPFSPGASEYIANYQSSGGRSGGGIINKVTNDISAAVTAGGSQNLKDFEEKNMLKGAVVDDANNWSMSDFVNGANKSVVPSENQWDAFKSQAAAQGQDLKSLDRKYGDLKQEESEISSEEERLAKIEKSLQGKEEELKKAQQAFEKLKDDEAKTKAKTDLDNLRKEVGGLQSELKNSQAEISKLRERHNDKVQEFKSAYKDEVARVNPRNEEERERSSVGRSFGNGANTEARRDDVGAQNTAGAASVNSPARNATARAAMAAETAGGSRSNSSATSRNNGASAAAITLTNDLSLISYKNGQEITLDKQVYIVIDLANGQKGLQVKGSDKYFMQDKNDPKYLLPVDKDGKIILLKVADKVKPAKNQRAPASEMPSPRKRKPFSVLDLNSALK